MMSDTKQTQNDILASLVDIRDVKIDRTLENDLDFRLKKWYYEYGQNRAKLRLFFRLDLN
jgi:hypothetical protein